MPPPCVTPSRQLVLLGALRAPPMGLRRTTRSRTRCAPALVACFLRRGLCRHLCSHRRGICRPLLSRLSFHRHCFPSSHHRICLYANRPRHPQWKKLRTCACRCYTRPGKRCRCEVKLSKAACNRTVTNVTSPESAAWAILPARVSTSSAAIPAALPASAPLSATFPTVVAWRRAASKGRGQSQRA